MDLSSLLGASKGGGGGSKSAPFKNRRVRHPKKIIKGGTSLNGAPPATRHPKKIVKGGA